MQVVIGNYVYTKTLYSWRVRHVSDVREDHLCELNSTESVILGAVAERDAEIARLRAELDAERFKRAVAESSYELLNTQSMASVRELERTERDLAAARAALAKEREACDEMAAWLANSTTRVTMCARWYSEWLARRAAEAKEPPHA